MSEQSKKKRPEVSWDDQKTLPTYLLCFLFIQNARKQTHTHLQEKHTTITPKQAPALTSLLSVRQPRPVNPLLVFMTEVFL